MTKKKKPSITQQCKLAHTYTYTTDSHDFFLQMQIKKNLHKRIFTKQNTSQNFRHKCFDKLCNFFLSDSNALHEYTGTFDSLEAFSLSDVQNRTT